MAHALRAHQTALFATRGGLLLASRAPSPGVVVVGRSARVARAKSTLGPIAASAGGSSAVGPSADAASYRVLAFEDSYNIEAMLKDAKVRYGHLEQRWTSHMPVEALEEFGRVDVLLLDFYLPPITGFKVLQQVNEAVAAGRIERPKHIIGMSSVMSCNRELVSEGADHGFVKWEIGEWDGWARDVW